MTKTVLLRLALVAACAIGSVAAAQAKVVAEPEITPQADYVYKINGPLSLDTCKKLEDKTLDPAAEAVAKREAEQEAEQARLEAAAAKESQ